VGFYLVSRLDTGARLWACSRHAENDRYLTLDFGDVITETPRADVEKMRQHSIKIKHLEQENTQLRAKMASAPPPAQPSKAPTPRPSDGPLPSSIGGRKSWFYGKISRDEAQRLLCQHIKVAGHFLVRQSNTIAGGWALSLLTAPDDPEPEHHVLSQNETGFYTINGEPIGASLRNIDDTIAYLLKNGHAVITHPLTDIVYNPLVQSGRKASLETEVAPKRSNFRTSGSMYLPGSSAPFASNVLITAADVGKRVVVSGLGEGYLRFFGPIRTGLTQAGVELDSPVGDNNGSEKGVSYFSCKDKYGVFLDPRKVIPVDSSLYVNVRDNDNGGDD